MAKHWKVFFAGWAVLLVIYWVFPPGAAHADPIFRAAGAFGGSLPAVLITLIGAGIGRMTRFGTATGIYNGGALAIVFVGLGVVAALAA